MPMPVVTDAYWSSERTAYYSASLPAAASCLAGPES
jgi:hypothetical protein